MLGRFQINHNNNEENTVVEAMRILPTPESPGQRIRVIKLPDGSAEVNVMNTSQERMDMILVTLSPQDALVFGMALYRLFGP